MTPLPGEPLTEAERRPLIDADGRRLLASLLEHERAPKYNHTCGDRLTRSGLAAVRAFDVETATTAPPRPGRPPAWLAGFVARTMATVPRYRAHGSVPPRFEQIPTIRRDDLIREPWAFVPDDHPLDDMVVFTTTGTTDGRLAYIPSTPAATASYAVLLRAALRTRELTLDGGPGRVAVAQICWQRRTYTYASISTFLGQGGLLKLNLNPHDWRHRDDIVTFLDAIDPEVLTGDPVAFAKLASLPVRIRPKALLSTAMTLTEGLRTTLEERFGCPAIDIYGMNEAGPIAAGLPDGSGHALLQPRLYTEILGADDEPVGRGERGEITLTGGFNEAFPLLRYRTGDHAALEHRGDRPVLVGLEGRPPVPFVTADGRAVNTIDVTVALRRFAAGRYTVHQRADRSLALGLDATGAPDEVAFVTALLELFGPIDVDVHRIDPTAETVMYSTDLSGP